MILAVFEEGGLFFSFCLQVCSSQVVLVTSFDHWGEVLKDVRKTTEDLDRVVELVSGEYGPVATALFMDRKDFDRLYDGHPHTGLPYSLILGSRAFGYSKVPGLAEEAFLNTAGLFAYVPLRIP